METESLPTSLVFDASLGSSSGSSTPHSPSPSVLIDPVLLNDQTHLSRCQTAPDQVAATGTPSDNFWSPEYPCRGVTSEQFAIERGKVEMATESDGDEEEGSFEYYPKLVSDVERNNLLHLDIPAFGGVYDESEEEESGGNWSESSAEVDEPTKKRRKLNAGRRPRSKAPISRLPRPLSLPSHESIRGFVASSLAERHRIPAQDALNHINALRAGMNHWSIPKREEEDVKVQAAHEAFIELLLNQMDPKLLAELRLLRPEAFNEKGKLKHELRKGLKDLYGAMIGNWPPIECLRDGIPVQGGKGTGMTEVLLARKGLITASIAFNDICVFYLTNEWTSTYPIDRLFTEEGKTTMYQQCFNGLAPFITQGLPNIAFGVDAHDHLLELDKRGYVDFEPLLVKIPIPFDDGTVKVFNLHVYGATIPNLVDRQSRKLPSSFMFTTSQICVFGTRSTSVTMRTEIDLHIKSFFAFTPPSVPLPSSTTDTFFINYSSHLVSPDQTDPYYRFVMKRDKKQRESGEVYTDETLEKIDPSSFTSMTLYTQRHYVELSDPQLLAYSRRVYPDISEEVRNSALHRIQVHWSMKGSISRAETRENKKEEERRNETEEETMEREEKEADEERRKGMSQSEKCMETRRKSESEEDRTKRELKEADEERRKGMSLSEKNMETRRKSESEEDRTKRELKEADEERRKGMTRTEKRMDTIRKRESEEVRNNGKRGKRE